MVIVYGTGTQPSVWFGNTELSIAPFYVQNVEITRTPANIMNHKIVNQGDNNEGVGYGQANGVITGFVAGVTSSSTPVQDVQIFTTNSSYLQRPIAIGWMDINDNTPSVEYATIGYATGIDFKRVEGVKQYKWTYSLSFMGIPASTIASSNHAAGNQSFDFIMDGQSTGYIVGFQLTATSIGSGVSTMSATITVGTAGTGGTIGYAPSLSPFLNFGAFNSLAPAFILPCYDSTTSQQSIAATVAPTGTYSITFTNAFSGGHVPAITVLYVNA
jgi:hypothetical protein